MDWSFIIGQTLQGFISPDAIIFAIAAIGLNVQFGYTGLLNFGQAAFMAAGAYGLGMTAHYFDISLWWGFAIGIAFSIVLGLLMGIPTLRLRADYLAIVTIAVAEIVRIFVRSVKFRWLFGGTDGINNFAEEYRKLGEKVGLHPAKDYGIKALNIDGQQWLVFTGRQLWTMVIGWTLVAIFGTIVYFLMKSPWGRVLKAIREDEDAVRSLGKNVYSYKMQALVLGGVIGTFAGFVLSLDRANVQPDNFSRDLTFFILTALVLGGVATVSGSIVGPMLYWGLFRFLDNTLRQATKSGPVQIGDTTLIQSTQIGQINYMIVGLALVLLMVYRPQGLFGNRKEMAFDGR